MRQVSVGLLLAAGLLVGACDRFDQQREAAAKRERVECLEKICEGDLIPRRDPATETLLKLNGQWYIGPSYYFSSGMNGASFYWPSKTNRHGVPEAEQKASPHEHTVEIFLRGRARWPDPKAERPWEGRGWEGRFEQLQSQGLRMDREQLTSELERVRFFQATGEPYLYEFFLASQQHKPRGNGVPGVACDLYPDSRPNALPRCNGAFFWQEDVYADFRFHSQHAKDWPAIHQEIARVLDLLKKVPQ